MVWGLLYTIDLEVTDFWGVSSMPPKFSWLNISDSSKTITLSPELSEVSTFESLTGGIQYIFRLGWDAGSKATSSQSANIGKQSRAELTSISETLLKDEMVVETGTSSESTVEDLEFILNARCWFICFCIGVFQLEDCSCPREVQDLGALKWDKQLLTLQRPAFMLSFCCNWSCCTFIGEFTLTDFIWIFL